MNDVAAPSVVPLSYETHPDLSRLTRADLPWLREAWEAAAFWEVGRPSHWQIVNTMIVMSLIDSSSLLTNLWLAPLVALEIAKLTTKKRGFIYWSTILWPFLFIGYVATALLRGFELPKSPWSVLLFVSLACLFIMIFMPWYLRLLARSRELAAVSLPPSFVQWMEMVKGQRQLSGDTVGLPRVDLELGGFKGTMMLARTGEVVISYVGTAIYLDAVNKVILTPDGPVNPHAATGYRLKIGTRERHVWLFEKDRAELEKFLHVPVATRTT